MSNESYVARNPIDDSTSHDVLLARIRCCPSRQWITDYFDLACEIIQDFEIASDDPRLVTSIPKGGALPITINQRYVLRGSRNGRVGLIMPSDYNRGPNEEVHPDYFFNNLHTREALWVEFPTGDGIELPERVKTCWKTAIEEELGRGRRSSFRRFHQPIVIVAIVNLEYRKLLLDQAFPQSSSGEDLTKWPRLLERFSEEELSQDARELAESLRGMIEEASV